METQKSSIQNISFSASDFIKLSAALDIFAFAEGEKDEEEY